MGYDESWLKFSCPGDVMGDLNSVAASEGGLSEVLPRATAKFRPARAGYATDIRSRLKTGHLLDGIWQLR